MNKKYQIIYVDPPWSYSAWTSNHKVQNIAGLATYLYPVLGAEQLKKLDVKSICDTNCALFLWATMPTLLQAIELISVWGFEYKTVAFVWVKRNRKSDGYFMGLGNYTRANAELCLLGMKGSLKRVSKSVRQICDSRITKHSQKPTEIRQRIVELFGDLSRIELFARERVDGWNAWGNEIESDVNLVIRQKVLRIC